MKTRYGLVMRSWCKRAICRVFGHLWSAWDISGKPEVVGQDGDNIIYRTPPGGPKHFRTCDSCGKYEERPA